MFKKEALFIRHILSVLLFFLIINFLLLDITFANNDAQLQKKINLAKPNDIVTIADGVYTQPLIINKPITLKGSNNVTFKSSSDDPSITIIANNVTLSDIKFVGNRDNVKRSEVLVIGNYNKLINLKIKTNGFGVKLNKAHYNELTNIQVEGNKSVPFSQRNNGIDLLGAHYNVIKESSFKHVQDGIYLESSKYNSLVSNLSTQSRYGYHLMFTEENTLEQNESYKNVSGIMVMGTKGTIVKNNTLMYNNDGVQSLGLLLYDVVDAEISNNRIAENRIGIFMEETTYSNLMMNDLQRNYIGIQLKKSKDNIIKENSLVSNVVQGQAERSSNNLTNSNYWGDHQGLDLNGNGLSDLSYTVDPFFLSLTSKFPPFQLFFQAPGMIFLEQLLHTPTEQWLIDASPLINNSTKLDNAKLAESNNVLYFSLFLLLISLTTILLGVKKQ